MIKSSRASRSNTNMMRVAHTHTARNLLENPRSNTGTDKVDFVELCTGLTVICGGKHLDKACCAYNLYDVQDQGYITRDDLERFLSSIFKVMFHVDSDARERAGCSAEKLATVTCNQAFKTTVSKGDRMTFDQFLDWYDRGSSGNSSDEDDEEEEEDENESKRLALRHLDVHTAFEDLAAVTNSNGTIDRASLRKCFAKWDPEHIFDSDDIFNLFDRDLNEESIDFRELAAGITVLCGGEHENRVEAAFALYDLNGDGVITPDEMRNMMESVFKVVFYVDPSHREKLGGIDPKELAESTWCSSVVFECTCRSMA